MRIFVLCFLLLFCLGCATVSKSVDNFQACKDDPVCFAQMEQLKSSSHIIVESAVSSVPFPSVPEWIAIGISNVLAFAFGAMRGKKKG